MSNNDFETVIEAEQIQTLVMAAGVDTVQAILDAFWASNAEILESLTANLGSENLAEASKSAHALKGSAGNLGATMLAERARIIETACKDNNSSTAKEAFLHVEADMDATRVAFEALIKAAAA